MSSSISKIKKQGHTKLSPLTVAIHNYKKINNTPIGPAREILHFREKNPDSANQIKFLEGANQLIESKKNIDKNLAELGVLLLFRTLLIDPNRRGEVYNDLIKKLKLDDIIEFVLNKINPRLEFDYSEMSFLKIAKNAMEYAQQVLYKKEMSDKFPQAFTKDVETTLYTEYDYLDRVMKAIRISHSKY